MKCCSEFHYEYNIIDDHLLTLLCVSTNAHIYTAFVLKQKRTILWKVTYMTFSNTEVS